MPRGLRASRRPAPALFALALFTLLARTATAQAPPAPRGRWHFQVPGEGGFAYSILFSRGAGEDETRLLLLQGAERLELVSRQGGTGSDSLESVRNGATGELFSRRLLLSGYAAIPGCEGVKSPDACLIFSGPNGTVSASLAAFAAQDAPALRTRIAALTSEKFQVGLFGTAPCFDRVLELSSYQDDFLGLVWPERFRHRTGAIQGGASRVRGCSFDTGFGFPCTEAERRREETRFGAK
ncbi:MAG: hypothetical protein ABIT01_01090 [Thermoanaerobaculia bacterium]